MSISARIGTVVDGGAQPFVGPADVVGAGLEPGAEADAVGGGGAVGAAATGVATPRSTIQAIPRIVGSDTDGGCGFPGGGLMASP